MVLRLYNDLSKKIEEFSPISENSVSMYVCGITPYDETHLGHARAYVVFDVVRRYLEYIGYKVNYIQNFTDIDDKIINKAREKNLNPDLKEGCREIAEQYISSYFDVMESLNVKNAAVYPRATQHIKEMVDWIKGLFDKGFAYQLDDGIYFEVSKFKDYGKLSKRKLEDMEDGARVSVKSGKRSPYDFVLWKFAKEGEPSWESPWGMGRPGWHIECSAMSTKYLGETFDIHGGGLDLEFPHHENEIAQTEALTQKSPWVKYWMHNGFVNVNEQKMSKSLGNFFTLKDIFKKYDPMVVRLFLLMTHYKSPINFSDEQLKNAKSAYERIVNAVKEIDFLNDKIGDPEEEVEVLETKDEIARFKAEFERAMDEDFNTAKAISIVFDFVTFINKHIKSGKMDALSLVEYKKFIFEVLDILGIKIEVKAQDPMREEIEKLVKERDEARKSKNFRRSDEIRDLLLSRGIILEDTQFGTKWRSNA